MRIERLTNSPEMQGHTVTVSDGTAKHPWVTVWKEVMPPEHEEIVNGSKSFTLAIRYHCRSGAEVASIVLPQLVAGTLSTCET